MKNTVKNTDNNSASAILAEVMKNRGMDIEKLAREADVPEHFIYFILEEKFEKLPAAPYLHGYILKIADVLEINGDKFWEQYFQKNQALKTSGRTDHLPKNRFAVSWLNKRVLIVVLVILAVVAYFLIRAFLSFNISRVLTIQNFNEERIVLTVPTYTIKGRVNPAYQLTINDSPVYPEDSGDFSTIINLEPGFNTIVFGIKGPLGRKDELVRQIYRTEDSKKPTTETTTTQSGNSEPEIEN